MPKFSAIGAVTLHHAVHEAGGADEIDVTELVGTNWTLIETLSPVAVNTISSSVLAAHDMWMLIAELYSAGLGALEENLFLQLNSDGGANYEGRYIDDTVIVQETGVTAIRLGSRDGSTPLFGIVYVKGRSAGGKVVVYGGLTRGRVYNMGLDGNYNAGADITRFTMNAITAFTGEIKIYYLDY